MEKRTHLETSGTPIDELDCSLCFNRGDSSVHIFGHNVASETYIINVKIFDTKISEVQIALPVQHTASHVFSSSRIAFYHLILRLKTC